MRIVSDRLMDQWGASWSIITSSKVIFLFGNATQLKLSKLTPVPSLGKLTLERSELSRDFQIFDNPDNYNRRYLNTGIGNLVSTDFRSQLRGIYLSD